MPDETPPAPKPITIETVAQLRVRLKYPDMATFVERFSPQVGQQGVFLQSRTPRPVGTKIRFELLLADGKTRAFAGEGLVSWVRDPETAGTKSPGMGVRFTRLDAEGNRLVERIVAYRREKGLRDESVPQPARADTTVPVRAPSPIMTAPAASVEGVDLDDVDDAYVERALAVAQRIIDAGVDDVIAELAKE